MSNFEVAYWERLLAFMRGHVGSEQNKSRGQADMLRKKSIGDVNPPVDSIWPWTISTIQNPAENTLGTNGSYSAGSQNFIQSLIHRLFAP